MMLPARVPDKANEAVTGVRGDPAWQPTTAGCSCRVSRGVYLLMELPSFALGILPLVATRRTAHTLGQDVNTSTVRLLRLLGLRELVVALAFGRRPTPRLLWSFVAQDVIDLCLFWWASCAIRPVQSGCFRRAWLAYSGLAAIDVYVAITRNRRSGHALCGHRR